MEQTLTRRLTAALVAALFIIAVLAGLLYRTSSRLKNADSAMAGTLYGALIYINDVLVEPNGSFGSLEAYEDQLAWAERIYPSVYSAHVLLNRSSQYSGYLNDDRGEDAYRPDREIDDLWPADRFFRHGSTYVRMAMKSRSDMEERAPQLADFCTVLEGMDVSAPGCPNVSDLYASMEQFYVENGYYVFDVKPPSAD